MVLEYVHGVWQLCPYRLTVKEFENERKVYVYDTTWWEDMSEKWDHIDILDIEEVNYTPEQRKRYEQIKNFPEDFGHAYSEYVEKGFISDDVQIPSDHPFNMVLLSNNVIIESSVNENGDIIKFADGTLIVKGSFHENVDINHNGTLEKTVLFPHVFLDEPNIVPSARFEDKYLNISLVKIDSIRAKFKVDTQLYLGDITISYVAIGKWK